VAQLTDPSTVISIKNGGGIRTSIGVIVVPAGGTGAALRRNNERVVDRNGVLIKPEGGISQTDIQGALSFNNGLTLLTLTKSELKVVLEHGVAALPLVSGRFPQVSGVSFSFDPTLPAGSRIRSAWVIRTDQPVEQIVLNGNIVGDAMKPYRIVTLGFLADGGDSYVFPMTNRVNLPNVGIKTGAATFADDGTEQDALAEFLLAKHTVVPYNIADVGRDSDVRMQNLSFRTELTPQSPTMAPSRSPSRAPSLRPSRRPSSQPSKDDDSPILDFFSTIWRFIRDVLFGWIPRLFN
jgi:uncharacterized protein